MGAPLCAPPQHVGQHEECIHACVDLKINGMDLEINGMDLKMNGLDMNPYGLGLGLRDVGQLSALDDAVPQRTVGHSGKSCWLAG